MRALMLLRVLLVPVVSLALSFAAPVAGLAADIRQTQTAEVPDEAVLRDYLGKRTLVYLTRGMFDVIALEEVPALVAADLEAARDNGLSPQTIRVTETDLLIEGGYLLTSLKYLLISGFPNWPEDRPEDVYLNDSMAVLDPLGEQLLNAVIAGADPIEVFEAAAQVYWWTEGSKEPIDGRGDFSVRDEIVATAMSEEPGQAAPIPAPTVDRL